MNELKESESVGEAKIFPSIKLPSTPASGSRATYSVKLRFEILKRDNFTCCYCGAKPPAVRLNVDHKTPVAKGGTNQPENLITSCHICNAGKSDVLLEDVAVAKIPTAKPMPNRRGRKYPSETFKAYSRSWRIYKRSDNPEANWYFQVEMKGKRYPTSLKTPSSVTAIAKAKLLVASMVENKFTEMRSLIGDRSDYSKVYASIDKYLQAFENTPTGENSARSRHHFVLAFRRVMSRVPKPPTHMDQLDQLFKQAREQANREIEFTRDHNEILRIKRSFTSEIANAAAVISERAVFTLKDRLVLPDFTELRQIIKHSIRFPAAKKTACEYRPPAADVLLKTFTEWQKLPRNEFLAVGLALACGMRKGEMKGKYDAQAGQWNGAAAWEWFTAHNGMLWCDGTGNFKDGTGIIRTQVLNPFWQVVVDRCAREGWEMKGLVITGNRSEFDKNVSFFLKSLGWQTRLHLHALRAWAGSLVFMKYGLEAARVFCRHSDSQITKDSYGWMKQDWHVENTPVLVAEKQVEWVKS